MSILNEKNKQPLFSVLIANYNNGKYLEETLNSIYNQTYENWEIIIVDDCSSDNSKEIYKAVENDKRIRIFYNNKNKGAGYAKKRCADEANGEICGFLDPDDTLANNALSKMVELHTENPDYSLIHSKSYLCDENMKITREYPVARNVDPHNLLFFNLDGAITHFSTFKKDFYNKTQGIDIYLQRAVDQDLYLKLYDIGKTLFWDEALYYYRIHEGGISTTQNARKAYYWAWVVVFSSARRRGINLESTFFDYFTPKHEFDHIADKYKKYRKIDKAMDKIKSLFS
ncbi:glycosyltransferase involved in cell wall biosynthesis [Dysgonomonas hofstadii]|uniref:Glycosyltransferase involved in cell wall biosynthesis n=1 Tax=Dysgonomonas hofstadii TaxID=637886 RepID=A0A840CQ39_9BACT|nr:glycosyltransferase [Dysgonomonas hofstadii]MBB4035065.1 glycosyltransferase involved in cell wall biosynthesis [Dysgonomonas hofstadii]